MPDSFFDDVADMGVVLELNIMTQVTLQPPTMLCIMLYYHLKGQGQKARETNLKWYYERNFFLKRGSDYDHAAHGDREVFRHR